MSAVCWLSLLDGYSLVVKCVAAPLGGNKGNGTSFICYLCIAFVAFVYHWYVPPMCALLPLPSSCQYVPAFRGASPHTSLVVVGCGVCRQVCVGCVSVASCVWLVCRCALPLLMPNGCAKMAVEILHGGPQYSKFLSCGLHALKWTRPHFKIANPPLVP